MEGKVFLVLGSGGLYDVYNHIRSLNVELYMADEPGSEFATTPLRSILSGFLPITFEEASPDIPARVESALKENHDMPFPDAVLTFNEHHVRFVPPVAQRLGLSSMHPEAVLAALNKAKARMLLKEAGLSSARHAIVGSSARADLTCALDYVGLPAIVKPCNGYHSNGVHMVTSLDEAMSAYEECKALMTNGDDPIWAQGSDIVVEELLEGSEHVAETVMQDGELRFVAIVDKGEVTPPWFEERDYRIPSLVVRDEKSVQQYIADCLHAVGFTSGQFDFEFKMVPNRGPVMIEINPRMGCGPMWAIVMASYGVDLIKMALRLALGEKVPNMLDRPFLKSVAAFYVHSPRSGTLVSAASLHSIGRGDHRVFRNYVYANDGYPVVTNSEGSPTRLSLIVVAVENRDEVLATADEILGKIVIPISVDGSVTSLVPRPFFA